MSIKKYIIGICFAFIAKFSFAQSLSNEFLKKYREAFYQYAGLDTSFYCLNSVVVLRFNLSKESELLNIACSPGISKEMQMKFKVALKRTQPLWKDSADTIDTSHSIIQLLYFEDDSGCLNEAKMYSEKKNIENNNADPMNSKADNKFAQMRKMRDINIMKSTFNMLSVTELKNGAFMLPAIIIKKTQ